MVKFFRLNEKQYDLRSWNQKLLSSLEGPESFWNSHIQQAAEITYSEYLLRHDTWIRNFDYGTHDIEIGNRQRVTICFPLFELGEPNEMIFSEFFYSLDLQFDGKNVFIAQNGIVSRNVCLANHISTVQRDLPTLLKKWYSELNHDQQRFVDIYGTIYGKSRRLPFLCIRCRNNELERRGLQTMFAVHDLYHIFFLSQWRNIFSNCATDEERELAFLPNDVVFLLPSAVTGEDLHLSKNHPASSFVSALWKIWCNLGYRDKLICLLRFLNSDKNILLDCLRRQINRSITDESFRLTRRKALQMRLGEEFDVYMSQCAFSRVSTKSVLWHSYPHSHASEYATEMRSFILDFDHGDIDRIWNCISDIGVRPFMVVATGRGFHFHFRIGDVGKRKPKSAIHLSSPRKIRISQCPQTGLWKWIYANYIKGTPLQYRPHFLRYENQQHVLFATVLDSKKQTRFSFFMDIVKKAFEDAGADSQTGALNQLFRVPGFYNAKAQRHARVLWTVTNPNEIIYTTDDSSEFLKRIEEHQKIGNQLAKRRSSTKKTHTSSEKKNIPEIPSANENRNNSEKGSSFSPAVKKHYQITDFERMKLLLERIANMRGIHRMISDNPDDTQTIQVVYDYRAGFTATPLASLFKNFTVAEGYRNSVVFGLGLIFRQEGKSLDECYEWIRKNVSFEGDFLDSEILKTLKSAFSTEKKLSPKRFYETLKFRENNQSLRPPRRIVMQSLLGLKSLVYVRKKSSAWHMTDEMKKALLLSAIIRKWRSGVKCLSSKHLRQATNLSLHQYNTIIKWFRDMNILIVRCRKGTCRKLFYINLSESRVSHAISTVRSITLTDWILTDAGIDFLAQSKFTDSLMNTS